MFAHFWATLVANSPDTRLDRYVRQDPRKRRAGVAAVGLGRGGRRDGGGRVEQRAGVGTRVRLDERPTDREPARCAARRRRRRY